ncbi:MAG: hypothetical protein ACRC5T_06415 [Cetobacterium sp.]
MIGIDFNNKTEDVFERIQQLFPGEKIIENADKSYGIEGQEYVRIESLGLTEEAKKKLKMKEMFFGDSLKYNFSESEGANTSIVISNTKLVNDLKDEKQLGDELKRGAISVNFTGNKVAVSEVELTRSGNGISNFGSPIAEFASESYDDKFFVTAKGVKKILQPTANFINGEQVISNANYNEIKKNIISIAKSSYFGGQVNEDDKKNLRYTVNKNLENISKENSKKLVALTSQKTASSIVGGADEIFVNKRYTSNQIHTALGTNHTDLDFNQLKTLENIFGKTDYKTSKADNEMLKAKDGTHTYSELIDKRINKKMDGNPDYYTIEMNKSNTEIANITAWRGEKSYTINELIPEMTKLTEAVNNDENNLFSIIPREAKEKINAQISESFDKNLSYEKAKATAKKTLNTIKKSMAETAGLNLENKIDKEIAKKMYKNYKVNSYEDTLTTMILSGRNISLTQDIMKQGNVIKGAVSNTSTKINEEAGAMDKFGQRAAQSGDKEVELSVTDNNGKKFFVGQSLQKIGEDQTKAKHVKYNDTMNKTVYRHASEIGMDLENTTKTRKDFIVYANSDYAFQDSNVMTTRNAYSLASETHVKLEANFSSMKINQETLGEELYKDYVDRIGSKKGFSNEAINVEGTLENRLVRGVLGQDNYEIYQKKENFINTIKEMGTKFGNEFLDLNNVDDQMKSFKREEEIASTMNENYQNNTIKIGGDAKGNIFSGDIIKDKFGGKITNASYALINDISFNDKGLVFGAKSIRNAGEGSKVMYDGTKATVQALHHNLALKIGDVFVPFGAMVNEKVTATKRGFGGQLISRVLNTAAFHAASNDINNNAENGLNSWLETLKNEKIEFNTGKLMKSTNVLELLGMNFSYEDGAVKFDNLLFNEAIKGKDGKELNMFDPDSKHFNRIMSAMAENVKKHAGSFTEADEHMLGNLVMGSIENAYEKYLNNFSGQKKAEQQIFINGTTGIFASGVGGKLEQKQTFDKGFRLLSHQNKMVETVARKSEDGFKIGRLGIITLAEQSAYETVDIINKKAAFDGAETLGEILSMSGYEADFAPGGKHYETYFKNGATELDLRGAVGNVRNSNISVTDFKKRSGAYNSGLITDSVTGDLEGPRKIVITNFDEKFKTGLGSFLDGFDNSIKAIDKANNEKYAKEYVKARYGDLPIDIKAQLETDAKAILKLVGEEKDVKKAITIKNFSSKKTSEEFLSAEEALLKGFDDEYIHTRIQDKINHYKGKHDIYGNLDLTAKTQNEWQSKMLKVKEESQNTKRILYGMSLNSSEKGHTILGSVGEINDDLAKRLTAVQNLSPEKVITQNHIAEVVRLINKSEENNVQVMRMINNFSGEGSFGLSALGNISKTGEMPFLLNAIESDASGTIVSNKSLTSLESIISINQEIKDIENFHGRIDVSNHETVVGKIQKKYDDFMVNVGQESEIGKKAKQYFNAFLKNNSKFKSEFMGHTDLRNISNTSDSGYAYKRIEKLAIERAINVDYKLKKMQPEKLEKGFSRKVAKVFNSKMLNYIADAKEFENADAHYLSLTGQEDLLSYNSRNLIPVSEFKTSQDILDYIKTAEGSLEEMSGNKAFEQNYLSLKSDVNTVKKIFSNSLEGLVGLTDTEKYFNSLMDFSNGASVENVMLNGYTPLLNESNSINEFSINETEIDRKIRQGRKLHLEGELSDSQSQIKKLQGKLISQINNYGKDQAAAIFTKNGDLTDAASATFKNSASFSSKEGTSIINDITNTLSGLEMGSDGTKVRKDKKAFKDFEKALKHLYGEEIYEEVKDLVTSKDVTGLNKQLRKYSGLAFGTVEEIGELGIKYNKDAKFFHGFLGRNPHQYVSSLQALRVSVVNDEMKDTSFFASYYGGNSTKPKGGSNSLNLLGRLTAMSAHGDHDGDVYQLLGFHAKDFAYAGEKSGEVAQKLEDFSKMQHNMRNIIASGENIETILQSDSPLEGNIKGMIETARKLKVNGKEFTSTTTNMEIFKEIEDQFYVQKNEMIRANLELIDEENKHSIMPEFKKLFVDVKDEAGNITKVNVDKMKASKMIASMTPAQRMALFLENGNLDEKSLKGIIESSADGTVEAIKVFRGYQENLKSGELSKEELKMMAKTYNSLISSSDTVIWQNTNLVGSLYGDNSGQFRTGQVHDVITNMREAVALMTQQDWEKKVYNTTGKYTNDDYTRNVIKSVKGFGANAERIDKLAISAKLGGKGLNPYEALDIFAQISKKGKGKYDLEAEDYKEFTKLNEEVLGKMFDYIKKNNELIGNVTNSFGEKGVAALGLKSDATVKDLMGIITAGDTTGYKLIQNLDQKLIDANMWQVGNDISDYSVANVYGAYQRLNHDDHFLKGMQTMARRSNSVTSSLGVMLKTQYEKFKENFNFSDGRQTQRIINKMREWLDKGESALIKRINKKNGGGNTDGGSTSSENKGIVKNNTTSSSVQEIEADSQKTKATSKFADAETTTNTPVQKSKPKLSKAKDSGKVKSKIGRGLINTSKSSQNTVENVLNDAPSDIYDDYDYYANHDTSNLEKNSINGSNSNYEYSEYRKSHLEEEAKNNAGILDNNEDVENSKAELKSNRIKELEDENNKLASKVEELAENISEKDDEIKDGAKATKASDAAETLSNTTATKANKGSSKIFSEQSAESTEKLKKIISKHKKVAMGAGAVTLLGVALSIFQKGRSVVKLDINDEQQAMSGRNLYRDISSGYDTNMNRRRFY